MSGTYMAGACWYCGLFHGDAACPMAPEYHRTGTRKLVGLQGDNAVTRVTLAPPDFWTTPGTSTRPRTLPDSEPTPAAPQAHAEPPVSDETTSGGPRGAEGI